MESKFRFELTNNPIYSEPFGINRKRILLYTHRVDVYSGKKKLFTGKYLIHTRSLSIFRIDNDPILQPEITSKEMVEFIREFGESPAVVALEKVLEKHPNIIRVSAGKLTISKHAKRLRQRLWRNQIINWLGIVDRHLLRRYLQRRQEMAKRKSETRKAREGKIPAPRPK